MLRRSFRFGLTLGLIAGVAIAASKLLGNRRASDPGRQRVPGVAPLAPREWPPLEPDPDAHPIDPAAALKPDPESPVAPAAPVVPPTAWVEPAGGVCPTSHPVKAKLGSKIFHLPGMLNYDRTRPDRCYVDGPAAEADGLRAAKR